MNIKLHKSGKIESNGGVHLKSKSGHQSGHLQVLSKNKDNLLLSNKLHENSIWLTTKESGHLLGLAKSTIKKHCQLGHFDTRPVKMRGGTGYEISLNSILEWAKKRGKFDVVSKIYSYLGVHHGEESSFETEKVSAVALARFDLLKLYDREVNNSERKLKAKEEFLRLYNAGVWEDLLRVLGVIKSWKTLDRWQKRLEEANGDVRALEPSYQPAGASITAEESAILLPILLHPNKLPVSEVIRTAKVRMIVTGIAPKSDATYRRWLEKWIKKNYDLYVMSREGKKAYNDKVLPYIQRDYNRIEVGDVIIADGHTFNFMAINPLTGKPKRMTLILFYDMKSSIPLGFEIMPTENTMAIASALRRAIITLGFVPRIAYLDNGRAFRGKYFTGTKNFETSGLSGLFARLGIETVFAWAYHGQSKTIERFFGVMSEFERRMPGYVGNSIENKPAMLMRNEKMHRRFFGEVYATVPEVAANLIEFFKEYANRKHTGGWFKGRTPAEVFNESLERVKSLPDYESRLIEPAALNYLMMSEEVRKVGRNGVRLFGKYFFNEALLPLRSEVTVRYDITDLSRVLVFDKSGKFICEATDEINDAVHPVAALLGTDEDVEHLRLKIEQKRGFEKGVRNEAKELFEAMNEDVSPLYLAGKSPENNEKNKQLKSHDDDAEDFWEMWGKTIEN